MKLFRPPRLSLYTRFVLGLSIMLLPLVLLGAGSLLLLHYVTAATEKVAEESIDEMHPVIHLQTLTLMAAMPPNDYLIHADPAEKEKFSRLARGLDQAFEETLVPSFGLAGEWKLVHAAREEWRQAKAIALTLLALPQPVGNPAAAREMKRMDGHIVRAVDLLEQAHHIIHREADEALARADAARRWAYALIAGIFIAGIAAIAMVAFALARSVLLPLQVLGAGVSRFGTGDLSHRVELNRMDELGQLANTFNTMAETLEKSRAALRIAAVAFETQEGILIADRDKHIIRVNRAFTRLTGYSAEEAIGRTPAILQYERQDADFYHGTWETIVRDKYWQGESWNRRKDGEFYPALLTISVVTDADGQVTNYVTAFVDITLQKKAEEALQKLNEELEARVAVRTADLEHAMHEAEQASRAKSDFLAAMSHEIRTPLNGVIGMVDVLHQTSLKGYQVEMADLIRESAFSLLGIIDDILDFSKIEAGKLEIESAPLPVADVVEKVCGMLNCMAEKKGEELTLFTDPAIPEEVMGDALRLRQVLVNLVNNAIKFSSGQQRPGRVSVRAGLVERNLEQACLEPGRKVVVEIRIADNGIGMDEKILSRLFTPFTQADVSTTRRFGGTGLGLVISRHLVELMGGEIAVQSELGKGSIFTVRLPFVPLPDAGRDLSRDAGLKPDLLVAGLSCLVVGSTEGLAGDLAAYLTHGGATVERAADLAAARTLLSTLPSGQWIWVIDTAGALPPLDELRAIARARPEHALRFVVIGRGQRREPRVDDAAVVLVDGNVLTRGALLKAAAIAAGRAREERKSPLPGKSEAEFSPPSREEARQQGRLILVAEDNETNQKVILHQLGLFGYTADVAGDGRVALERWQSGDYALLLSDLHMPKMDGYQLTAAIRAAETGNAHAPIVALTANALKSEAEHCRAAGMDDYLSKPARLADMKAMLEKWLPLAAGSMPDGDVGRALARHVGLKSDLQAAVPVDVRVLKALVGDDPAMISEFLHDFRVSAAKTAAELKAACQNGQAAQAGALAHKLKSSARSVGALALGELCAGMEQAGKAEQVEALTERLSRFEAEMTAVDEYLGSL